MKKYLLILIPIVFALASCNNTSLQNTPMAHGNPGDVVVVMSNESWNSEPGDTMKAIFHAYCPSVPMEEHIFDLHQIPKDQFIDQNMYHRNIIYQEIDPEVTEAELTITQDRYAKKQVFVNVVAPNQAEFVKIVSKYQNNLIKLFLEADRDRWIEQLTGHTNKTVCKKILENFDVSIKIPTNYYLDVIEDDFAWISHESRTYSMALFVYTYPLADTTKFTTKYLITERNKKLKKYVPGSRPDSYMSTEIKYDYPYLNIINHNNIETAVMRGLWKVKGDFMGGPFVSYTKIDKPRDRVVCVEAYVYYPNEEVRDKIRQLEGIVYTYDLVK